MNQSVSGCVVDEKTGEPLTSPDVHLYRIGVPGENVNVLDEHGCFSFTDLSAGEYSLAVYDGKYVPQYERLTLADGEPLDALYIALKPGAFLSGRILDENHMPPWRGWFSLIRAGERGGKSGYIDASDDHRITDDGTFCSPPLGPDLYFLRFHGILHEPPPAQPAEPSRLVMQKRLFDFLYPEAQDISDATGFNVQAGKTISGLQIQIPRPIWYTVRGKLTGDLQTERSRINVMFWRTMGTNDGAGGGAGAVVGPDGTFESQVQSGVYSLDVCEFPEPEPDGRTRVLRKLATANIQVYNADLDAVEIHIPTRTAV